MRTGLFLLALAVTGLLISRTSLSAPAETSITRLAWMAGCWERVSGTRVSEEIWMPPAGGVMLGMSRALKDGRVVETEFMEIRDDGGRLIFTAWPSGQSKASFSIVEVADSMVAFGNPAHDFPQKIGYQQASDGSLSAWIEGTQNGKARRVDFPMTRGACPGASRR